MSRIRFFLIIPVAFVLIGVVTVMQAMNPENVIRVNSSDLHRHIAACTAQMDGMLPPDGFDLYYYLERNNISLRQVQGREPQIFAAINGDGELVPLDSTLVQYGDYVVVNPTPSSSELLTIDRDGRSRSATN